MLLVSAAMLVATWLLLKKTRVGMIIQASLSHPQMASALGHNVPMVLHAGVRRRLRLAGLAGVIGGNYQTTEPAWPIAMGPIVFVVVVFGGLGFADGMFHRLDPDGHGAVLRGGVQRLAARCWSSLLGITLSRDNSVRGIHDGAARRGSARCCRSC